MNISSKYLAAVFFIACDQLQGDKNQPIEKLLHAAGAIDISAKPDSSFDSSGRVNCTWSGMTCKAEMYIGSNHQVLHLYFLQANLFALVGDKREPLPLQEDGALQLAFNFRDTCLSLSPKVAFVATHLSIALPEYALEREWMVTARDANALADLRLGLLYLDDEIDQYWTSNPVRDDRDKLNVSHGRLVFAGHGWGRWF